MSKEIKDAVWSLCSIYTDVFTLTERYALCDRLTEWFKSNEGCSFKEILVALSEIAISYEKEINQCDPLIWHHSNSKRDASEYLHAENRFIKYYIGWNSFESNQVRFGAIPKKDGLVLPEAKENNDSFYFENEDYIEDNVREARRFANEYNKKFVQLNNLADLHGHIPLDKQRTE